MSELSKRILTAVIGGAVFLLLLYGHYLSFVALFGFIVVFCVYEFSRPKFQHISQHSLYMVAYVLMGYLFSAFLVYFSLPLAFLWAYGMLLVLFLLWKSLWSSKISSMDLFSYELTTLVYIGLPFFLLPMMVYVEGKFEPFRVLSILLLIWTNDTFAYFTGKYLGKHKLWERISPKKTWEGFVGGLLACMLVSVLICSYTEFYTFNAWISLGILVSIMGTIGDLIESSWKRSLSLKDSGTLLPGHGGFLDRFDSFIFVVPAYYLFNMIFPLL